MLCNLSTVCGIISLSLARVSLSNIHLINSVHLREMSLWLFDAVHFHRFIQRAWNWASMLTSADILVLVILARKATMSLMLRHLLIGVLIWWSLMAATLMLQASTMVSPSWLHYALLFKDLVPVTVVGHLVICNFLFSSLWFQVCLTGFGFINSIN